MILFDRVSYTYPGSNTPALVDIDIALQNGSFTFLKGHSGAGKTTLIRLLMAMIMPNTGRLQVNGQVVNDMLPADIPRYRRRIGLVFQDHQLLFDRSVWDNVALPLEIIGLAPESIASRVAAVLEWVQLQHKTHINPSHLSVGEQQRVCIARAVVVRPRLLIADEPTGNLDDQLSLRIMELFKSFHQANTTVLIATHDQRLMALVPDALVLTLYQGKLVQQCV